MSLLRMLGYFFGEGLVALWRHKALHGFALFVVALSLYILGLSRYLTGNVNTLLSSWEENLEVRVFLEDTLPPERVREITELFEGRPGVASVRLVTAEEALKVLAKLAPALAGASREMGQSPLPPSLSLRLKTPLDLAAVRRLVQEASAQKGVTQVLFDWEWVEKLRTYSRFVSLVGWLLFGALGVAAVFTVAAITRILALSRREEIAILHFVGATSPTIRGPFIAGGLLLGLLSSLAALLLLALTHATLNRYVGQDAVLLAWVSRSFLSARDQILLVAAGTLLGALGGALSTGSSDYWEH
jgi:cell division transport system permease protein